MGENNREVNIRQVSYFLSYFLECYVMHEGGGEERKYRRNRLRIR